MICIDFCVIYKYRVKQLMIFERTVAAASDFKNCTMVNCDMKLGVFNISENFEFARQRIR